MIKRYEIHFQGVHQTVIEAEDKEAAVTAWCDLLSIPADMRDGVTAVKEPKQSEPI